MEFEKFLASPLKKAVDFMEENQFNYKLTQVKPPSHYDNKFKNKGLKRVLKLEKVTDYYLITWSFQYNS
ncbi:MULTISPECIES: hypothetical protein [Halanaerobium]|jgi:hypothetical protein|uniref:Uncharacterized protein n=1 Tax=Halanaerobium kushneri TaxID=56779 RepID=A0A1N6PYD9_9FIRM|nr:MULTISPECIES: hypothetical protein [Halanaerobium]RCW55711.1 hypothetical protein DFR80_11687 [Halanaerobium sp. ST460_2HS_T2]SIQ09424.1 hypothetical protein SAMN05421834_101255 [Halanaerobium kushneri]